MAEIYTQEAEIHNKKIDMQRINFEGNIELISTDKMCITVNKVNIDTLKQESIQVSKDYLYLDCIDDDIYIFAQLSYDPIKMNYPEQYNNVDADIKYGILKLKRDENGDIIPNKEETIVSAIYDNISPDCDKTVIVNYEGNYTYFDYEKGVQLTPVVLKHAVPFNVGYEGFAECSTENKEGYLPRDAKPVTKEEDIKLLSEEQVKALVKYQEIIDNVYDYDNLYEDITGHSYRYRKKYD